jgi:ankyrin repeat protein
LHHFERIVLLDRSYFAIVGDPKETIVASGLFDPPKKQRPTPVSSETDGPWIDDIDRDSLAGMESALLSGRDPNVKNRAGSAALHLAVGKRNLPLVELLLTHGADTELRDNRGNTALHVALYDRDPGKIVEIASLLLRAGADPNTAGSEQVLPLCRLIDQERDRSDHTVVTSIANLLLDAGADVNHDGCAPLHYTHIPDRIAWLLAKGAELEAKAAVRRQDRTDYGKVTPLWNAVHASDISLVETFLKAGADVNGRDSVTGYTPLHLALARVRYQSTPKDQDLTMIDIFLSNGADPDMIAYDGTTISALDAHQVTHRASD